MSLWRRGLQIAFRENIKRRMRVPASQPSGQNCNLVMRRSLIDLVGVAFYYVLLACCDVTVGHTAKAVCELTP